MDERYLDMLGNDIRVSDVIAYPSLKVKAHNAGKRRNQTWRYAEMSLAIVVDKDVYKDKKRIKVLNVATGRITTLLRFDKSIRVNEAREACNETVANAVAIRERCFLMKSVKRIDFAEENWDEHDQLDAWHSQKK